MEPLTDKQIKDLKVLAQFIALYCRCRHDRTLLQQSGIPGKFTQELCPDCSALLEHGIEKREKCPLNPKPSCKKCHIHCYSREYRTKIREIMAFSGKRMILRGRLDYLWRYLF